MSHRNAAAAGIILALLTGCGGGGGGDPTPAPSPPAPAPSNYQVGGTLSGLNGTVVLQLGGANDLSLTTNGPFSFSSALASGTSYSVTVRTQPTSPAQNCVVANGTGTVASAHITNVTVTCANVPLTLSASTPATGATGVARSVVPSMTFSADIDASTAVPANVTLTGGSANQPITVAVSGTRVDVTPASRLQAGVAYTLNIGTGLRGTNGEAPAAPIVVTFTTVTGGWSTPVLLENQAGLAVGPQVRIADDGSAMAVWQQFDGTRDRIRFNYYAADSGWAGSNPLALDPDAAELPHVGMDGSGHALAAWHQVDATSYNIFSSRFTPGYGFTYPAPVSSGFAASNARIAVNSAGRAALVWTQFDDVAGGGTVTRVWAANYFVATGWTVPVLIDTLAVTGASLTPEVAIDAAGNVTAIWSKAVNRNDINSLFDIWANRYTTGGAWTGAERVDTDDTGNAHSPQLSVNAAGDAVAVWHSSDGVRNNIWAARRPAGGSWAGPALIETGSGTATFPQVAIDAEGNAIAVWSQFGPGIGADIFANRFQVVGGWGTAQVVDSEDGGADAPQIAMSPTGTAQLVWRQYREGSRYDVMSSRWVPGATWTTPEVISTEGAGTNLNANSPRIAINAAGVAQAVWLRSDGARDNVWAARFD